MSYMPHLSPLLWATAPIIFWFILLTFSSIIWWSSSPTFHKFHSSKSFSFSSWKWA